MKKTDHDIWMLHTITNHMLDILIIVDHNQIIMYVTPSIESILGYSVEELVGKNAFDPIFPEDRNRLMESHREVVSTKQPKVDEYRALHKNGDIKYLESRVMPVQDYPEQLVVVSIRDITFRKQMEKELEHQKKRYQQLQNSLKSYSQDLSKVMKVPELKNRLIKELEMVIPWAKPQMLILNREENAQDSYLQTLSIGKLQHVNDQIYILLSERQEMVYILTIQASSINESMEIIWLETLVYYTVMVFESLNVIESLMHQLENELEKSNRPQWILRLMFHLSEKQRMELSSELHDTVLQVQMALYRKLETIVIDYSFEKEMDHQLNRIIQGLLDSIYKIRVTCNELRPPLLREMGLVHALVNLFDYTQISSTFKIRFTTENTEGLLINEEVTIGVYRIVQELLNNAIKHSQAVNVYFHMSYENERMHLHYLDDGVGTDLGNLTPSFKSIGLSGIRERIRSLNGTIVFTTEPGNGLSVKMQIPIHV